MANAAALINEGMWRKDKEFQALPRLAQCTYLQVLSQKDLDCAGVLTLHLELLAKGCNELTADDLRGDFKDLEAARFVFVDYDTDEIFIRSYVRLVSVKGGPNTWKSVFKAARMVVSEKIRHELAAELRRLGRRDADELAAEIDPVGTPFEPPPNGVRTPSESDTPFEPPSNPPSSVPVSVLGSPSVVGTGGRPARPECSKHEENSDENCRACMRRRQWDETHAEAKAADELETKRAARAAELAAQHDCRLCDDDGWLLGDDGTPTEPATRCTAHLSEARRSHA